MVSVLLDCNSRFSSVSAMLSELSWPSLETRHKISRLATSPTQGTVSPSCYLQFHHITYHRSEQPDHTIHYISSYYLHPQGHIRTVIFPELLKNGTPCHIILKPLTLIYLRHFYNHITALVIR